MPEVSHLFRGACTGLRSERCPDLQVHVRSLGSFFPHAEGSGSDVSAVRIRKAVELEVAKQRVDSEASGAQTAHKALLLASHGRLMWLDVESGDVRVRKGPTQHRPAARNSP